MAEFPMSATTSLLSAPLWHLPKPSPVKLNPKRRTSVILRSPLQSSLQLYPPPTQEATQNLDFSVGIMDLPLIQWISPNFQPAKPNLNSIIKVKEDYESLRRRQILAETQAYEEALNEYKELKKTMLEKKMAPSLPYVKSLCLSWFEQLRDAIERDKQEQMSKIRKKPHGYYIGQN